MFVFSNSTWYKKPLSRAENHNNKSILGAFQCSDNKPWIYHVFTYSGRRPKRRKQHTGGNLITIRHACTSSSSELKLQEKLVCVQTQNVVNSDSLSGDRSPTRYVWIPRPHTHSTAAPYLLTCVFMIIVVLLVPTVCLNAVFRERAPFQLRVWAGCDSSYYKYTEEHISLQIQVEDINMNKDDDFKPADISCTGQIEMQWSGLSWPPAPSGGCMQSSTSVLQQSTTNNNNNVAPMPLVWQHVQLTNGIKSWKKIWSLTPYHQVINLNNVKTSKYSQTIPRTPLTNIMTDVMFSKTEPNHHEAQTKNTIELWP